MSSQNIYLASTKYSTFLTSQTTVIHRITVSGSNIVPSADGEVEGIVNNQFLLDEFNNVLRVATTSTTPNSTFNSVFCLNM